MKKKNKAKNDNNNSSKPSKVLTIIFISFLVLTVGLTTYFSIMKKNGKPAGIFGNYIAYVVTGSMEDTLMIGDVIVVKKTPIEDIKVGDIVTYKSTDGQFAGHYITHRVIDIIEHPNNQLQFITKGDSPKSSVDTEYVNYAKILGVYKSKVGVLTFVLSVLSKPIGFILVVISPLILLFGLQVKNFVLAIKDENKN